MPLAGDTVAQLAELLAPHAQPVVAVTGMEPLVPAAGALTADAVAYGAHTAPVCVTEITLPATVNAPLRVVVPV